MIRPSERQPVSQVPRHAPAASVPWLPRDLVNLSWTTLAGGAGLFGGYVGSSATARVPSQLPWIALAVGAVAVAGLGNALWLAAGARVTSARRGELLRRCAALTLQGPSTAEDAVDGQLQQPTAPLTLVATSEMTRYHLAGCPLVRGKKAMPSSEQHHVTAGRRPCGICLATEVS